MFGSEIELTQILQMLGSLLLMVIGEAVVAARLMARKKFNIDIDKKYADLFNENAERAIDYAVEWMKGSDGKVSIQLQNQMVVMAANYLIGKIPDTLKHFRVDEEGLRKRIRARIVARLGQPDGVELVAADPDAPAQPDYPLPPEMPPVTG
jgi:hypothetical protein